MLETCKIEKYGPQVDGMIQITFTRRALRDIKKLSLESQRRTELTIDALFDDVKAGDGLHGKWEGYWKLRAGDYRIIYLIKDESHVEIQYVRHRRRAYQRR